MLAVRNPGFTPYHRTPELRIRRRKSLPDFRNWRDNVAAYYAKIGKAVIGEVVRVSKVECRIHHLYTGPRGVYCSVMRLGELITFHETQIIRNGAMPYIGLV